MTEKPNRHKVTQELFLNGQCPELWGYTGIWGHQHRVLGLGPKGLGQKLALETRGSFRRAEHQDGIPSEAPEPDSRNPPQAAQAMDKTPSRQLRWKSAEVSGQVSGDPLDTRTILGSGTWQ